MVCWHRIPASDTTDAPPTPNQLGDLPIENLTQTAEENGVVIIAWNRDEGQFDGLSGWCNGDIPVTVVNMGVDVDRRRFNLGHELGHLLMQTAEEQSESLAHRR
jgi:Zn-dependent peptidase ImmA (M78 family)